MDIPQIISELLHFTPKFPREAILAAREKKQEIIPELLKILERTAVEIDEVIEDEDYMGHIFAAFLLAEFREPLAFPRLLRLLHQPDEKIDALWSDLLHMDVPRFLASTCQSNPLLLEELAEDLTSSVRARKQGFQALRVLVLNDEMPRDALVKYLLGQLQKAQTNSRFQDRDILGEIACIAGEIHPDELMLDLASLYDRDLVEENLIPLQDLREVVHLPMEEVLAESKDHGYNRLPVDTIAELETWPCYSDKQHGGHARLSTAEAAARDAFVKNLYDDSVTDEESAEQDQEAEHGHPLSSVAAGGRPDRHHHHDPDECPECRGDHVSTEPTRAVEGPGRNDPCPCRSGKKFKKCCGNPDNLH